MICKYIFKLQFYRTFNNPLPEIEWLDLNFVQTNTQQQTEFNIVRSNNLLAGLDIMSNRIHELSGVIPLDWFNRSINSFTILCKNKYLTLIGLKL
jgi:hypothetical protein